MKIRLSRLQQYQILRRKRAENEISDMRNESKLDISHSCHILRDTENKYRKVCLKAKENKDGRTT